MHADEKILFVDDEAMLLDAIKRTLRNKFQIVTAIGPEAGLAALADQGPFAVVVSDMQMPGMNGITFLERVKRQAKDTVRMMLTGNADQQTAAMAINEGSIFRFITKPAAGDRLAQTLNDGLAQYRLIVAERQLLAMTLAGSVGLLADVLSFARPQLFDRSTHIRSFVSRICDQLSPPNRWEIEIAASLCHLGLIALDDEQLNFWQSPNENVKQTSWYHSYPDSGARLIDKIPRLQGVAELVRWQHRGNAESENTFEHGAITELPLASKILNIAIAFDAELQIAHCPSAAYVKLTESADRFDPAVLEVVSRILEQGVKREHLRLFELQPGMILEESALSKEGDVLLAKDRVLNDTLLLKLNRFASVRGIREPIAVRYYPHFPTLSSGQVVA